MNVLNSGMYSCGIGAAKVELPQFTLPALPDRVDELGQGHSTEAEFGRELGRNSCKPVYPSMHPGLRSIADVLASVIHGLRP
jgi:hypothetical protein